MAVEIKIVRKKVKVGGGSKKGRRHSAHQVKYQKQKTRTARNKEIAWRKHLEKHPNDLAAQQNLKKKLSK